jgi:signal transduction histidine kinase
MKPRTASRLAWGIGVSAIALMVASLALMFVDRHVHIPSDASSTGPANVLTIVVNIAGTGIGIVVASRRPANPIGWMFLAAGAVLGINAFAVAYGVHALVAHGGTLPAGLLFAWIGNWTGLIPLGFLAFLFLLFPTGRLLSRRWRPVAWYVAIAFGLLSTAILVFSTTSYRDPYGQQQSSSGVGATLIWLGLALLTLSGLALSVAAVMVRYRRSVGDERLQLKWFTTAAVLVLLTFIPQFMVSTNPALLNALQSAAFLFLFSAIGIAVLKYRLYEIDVVINKAVVYGTLAAFITIVYVGLVVGVGALVGNRRSPLLSAVAAAVVAVAFQPIRARSQRLANRIAYGRRATPYEVLSDFAERMAGTYSLDDVLPRTALMLAEGTGAARADVWLLAGSELHAAGSWPEGGAAGPVAVAEDGWFEGDDGTTMVPVRFQGELLGALSIRKDPGDPVTAADRKLLEDVASQAGLVLRNVALIEDLRASRQRIVAAQDAAARRLERDIHDGAQQQLVALAVKARLAETLLERDPPKGREILHELQQGVVEALADLRDLARGIYPPLLADQGLAAALQAQVRKVAIPVDVDAGALARYRPETEAAVYFSVLEGLQNVAKYAGASHASVRLGQSNGSLSFEVTDDGVGFDASATTYGTGLQGIADRLAAQGGSLEVSSRPGSGTTIRGRLPV